MVRLKYDSFFGLKPSQAQQYFNSFIAAGPERINRLAAKLTGTKLRLDYSMKSIVPLMKEVAGQIRMYREGETVEQAVVVMDGRNNGMVFDDNCCLTTVSEDEVLGVAYYYGECFVRAYPFLSWGIGPAKEPSLIGFQIGSTSCGMLSKVWTGMVQTVTNMQRNNPNQSLKELLKWVEQEKRFREQTAT